VPTSQAAWTDERGAPAQSRFSTDSVPFLNPNCPRLASIQLVLHRFTSTAKSPDSCVS
jgi:hypothetical protein